MLKTDCTYTNSVLIWACTTDQSAGLMPLGTGMVATSVYQMLKGSAAFVYCDRTPAGLVTPRALESALYAACWPAVIGGQGVGGRSRIPSATGIITISASTIPPTYADIFEAAVQLIGKLIDDTSMGFIKPSAVMTVSRFPDRSHTAPSAQAAIHCMDICAAAANGCQPCVVVQDQAVAGCPPCDASPTIFVADPAEIELKTRPCACTAMNAELTAL